MDSYLLSQIERPLILASALHDQQLKVLGIPEILLKSGKVSSEVSNAVLLEAGEERGRRLQAATGKILGFFISLRQSIRHVSVRQVSGEVGCRRRRLQLLHDQEEEHGVPASSSRPSATAALPVLFSFPFSALAFHQRQTNPFPKDLWSHDHRRSDSQAHRGPR